MPDSPRVEAASTLRRTNPPNPRELPARSSDSRELPARSDPRELPARSSDSHELPARSTDPRELRARPS
ncbi:hypothetical protein ACFYO9_05825 [Streptomyces sp. NPDC005863]|uniref:hypothetical protein n=1 Tax=Streptomyces sp. NPDC005863 TaxID=3364735 RepID=UPI003697BB8F